MNYKAILIPGNGGQTPKDNWLPYLETELPKIGLEVINRQFPDSMLARSEFWLPFIKSLGADENTVLIGHSSGAIAAMRYAESNKILGSVLVSAYYTNLGIAAERVSGYFEKDWDWDAIRKNQQWVIQFSSADDPFVPIEEARYVNEKLNSDYHEFKDQKHFGYGKEPKLEFPEIIDALKNKLSSAK